jgi:signal transduction histidine kinase/CheY-like chemotaxis protein
MAAEVQGREQLGRILVVEDERIVALDLVRTLEDLGYEVLGSVATGEAAVAVANETLPDAVLMDIRLAGGIDGILAADQIRSTRDIPVIYLTAHADDETLRRAKQTGPSAYIVKPFKAVELRCALEIALHKHEIDSRLRARQHALATTLRAIRTDVAPAPDPQAVAMPAVAGALTGWQHGDALDHRLGDITRLIAELEPVAAAPTHTPTAELARFNAELEHRVSERTAALEAANRELDAFSASVAHDLRAPLRHIDGFSQILIEDHAANLGSDGLALLRRVRSATSQMGHLIEDLLRLSRVGKAAISRGRVDVSAMAHTVIDGLRASHGRAAQVSIAEHLEVDADPGLLRIVLENLLGNAWKFTSRTAAPAIDVGARTEDGAPAIFVRDNGAGFDAAHAETLFGAFQRFHRSSEFEGNGMGLAIVERIVKRHGGRIWADSSPGAGATFYFVM